SICIIHYVSLLSHSATCESVPDPVAAHRPNPLASTGPLIIIRLIKNTRAAKPRRDAEGGDEMRDIDGRAARAAIMVSILLGALVPAAGCRRGRGAPPGFQGILEYDQRIIGFEVAGRVSQVPARRGQLTQAGDVLARLDDTLALSSRDARQAELQAA